MSIHVPVLLHESIENLKLSSGKVFLDGTLGSGGHSAYVAERFGTTVRIIGLDQDPDAVKRSEKRLRSPGALFSATVASFRNIDQVADKFAPEGVDAILLDLGISSDQLSESGRGFTFQNDEPLDMRMGKSGVTAAEILNTFPEETLELIIRGFGEERYSRKIAREIVLRRESRPFRTTNDLLEAVGAATPASYKRGRLNPATKTFQALRIAVNDELGALEEALPKALEVLKPSGRLAVITFHSLEDRIVKNFFKETVKGGRGVLINKKPITASEEETNDNPRSRSSKLRVIEKI